MAKADFPIYVCNQQPGDLVVFPPMTTHQILNIAPSVTKIAWNVLHHSSVQLVKNDIRHMSRTTSVLLKVLEAIHEKNNTFRPEEISIALEFFQNLLDDERFELEPTALVRVRDTKGGMIECDFCGCNTWNRHLYCDLCGDFDLCMACFVSGRSCQHWDSLQLTQIRDLARFPGYLQQAMEKAGVSFAHKAASK